jgi:hypothetical protein
MGDDIWSHCFNASCRLFAFLSQRRWKTVLNADSLFFVCTAAADTLKISPKARQKDSQMGLICFTHVVPI